MEYDSSLHLFVDKPNIVDAKALQPIRGTLQIEGWALAREGVAAIDVSINGQHTGTAKYGLRREDVGANWPDWENSRLSGYALPIPARALATGVNLVRVALRARTGRMKVVEFSIETEQPPKENTPWALRRKMARSEIDVTEGILSGLDWHPLLGIVLGVDDSDDDATVIAALQSLREQVYGRWHAIVACKGGDVRERLVPLLGREFADLVERVRIAAESEVGSFADAIARGNGVRRPDLIGILLAGDVLACDALLQMAVSSGLERDGEFFYSDERRTSPISGSVESFFKPRWSPDLLLATNYIGRFWCARPALLERAGAGLGCWHRFGEYDLVLRCTEEARSIRHVPGVLCERGRAQIDDPARERESLTRAMARRDIDGELAEGWAPGYYRLRRRCPTNVLVSIIIPTGGNVSLLSKCVSGIFERTNYHNFEVIILHNRSTRPEVFPYLETITGDLRVKIIDSQGPFNFSRICNLGAAAARGEILLFLNDDIEVIEPDWINVLIQHAERPEVGAVGARLLYPDGKVQHAGMFWTGRGGRHAFRFSSQSDPGYFGLAVTPRNVIAVTGACIMMRRSWFETIGGFDESHSIINNDVDICLRCLDNGGLVVYEPAATLIHHELASRHNLPDEYDVEAFWKKWGSFLQTGDPYYHPNLSRSSDDYSVDEEPVQLIYAGHPLFCREEIRRIVVVKLDHLGDFITAVPALKRLQNHFPDADLYLLASQGAGALAGLVPEIREVIRFGSFVVRSGLDEFARSGSGEFARSGLDEFARSGVGEHQVAEEGLTGLRRRLGPYRFDLAIDLSKYPDKRNVLRATGARWFAGYDRDGRFPWLDIALEWEGDERLIKKRSHIGDDLCRLVDAVALAATRERQVLRLPETRGTSLTNGLAPSGRRLVYILPAVGLDTKQWPAAHYAALIDLLALENDVEIVLIGSSDEAAVAAEVLEKVRNKEAVRSLVGATKLADLPGLLASAALFVGNDSGPKHIAAGLGIPTIGIHSGVVDAREWGPIGPNAVAVQRAMRCSPCYIGKAEQCPRGLCCLTELHPSTIYEICRLMLQIGFSSYETR